jgi:hypothetical protein
MFEVVAFDRVLVDELEVSEPVSHPGGICKVHVIQQHPTFLVELPWMVARFDLSSAASKASFKLYLDPPCKTTGSWCDFVKGLEKNMKERLLADRVIRSLAQFHSMIEEGAIGGRYMTIKVPPSACMYSCFDTTSGKDMVCDLNDVKRGMLIKLILDCSEIIIDNKKAGFSPRLFQLQAKGCPKSSFMKAASTSATTKTHPTVTPAVRKHKEEKDNSGTASRKAFVPNLEDIIKRKNQLQKTSAS